MPTTDFLKNRAVPVVLFVALALIPVYAQVFDDRFVMLFATRILILAIAALSLGFILGLGAMVSFGHAAYLGLGAYAVGILAYHDIWEAWISFPAAILVCAVFAAVTGAISLKTRGVYFIMITLAFGQMAYYTATSLSAYGGDDGLTMWGRSEFFGTSVFSNDTSFYWLVFGTLLAAFLFLKMVAASRFGRVLKGAKQNEARLQAIGIDPFAYRLTAFVIAGVIAGLAGALMANQAEFVAPAYMSWHRSGELIVMVVLGGMGYLHGAIIGAVAYLVLEEVLSGYTQHWRLIFGPLLILVVLYARGGILGAIKGRAP
ncbi:MAG: branched-chain amino acid ABC transporter permease [Roseibium sp.]|nr:branched-chain amino acid ABC transporter permease [Roseibium sp.]